MESLWLLIILVTIIAHAPAIGLFFIGRAYRKTKPTLAKVLYIISGVYLIVGLGICGSMLFGGL